MSDGETPEEALGNGRDALAAWLQAARESGREVPHPGEPPSGSFVARVPRSLHARLAAHARQQGVGMNAPSVSRCSGGRPLATDASRLYTLYKIDMRTRPCAP